MNILVIIGNYYPLSSSVANCTKPLLKSLVEDGHNVQLVTNNNENKELISVDLNGINVHGIVNPYAIKVKEINGIFERAKTNKYLKTILVRILKLPYYIRYNLFPKEPGMGGWSIKNSTNYCLKLHQNHHFDVMISVSQPFTPHLIAQSVKKHSHNGIMWIAYEFDPYSYNSTFSKYMFLQQQLRNQELAVFAAADKIILTPELHDYYKDKDLGKYYNKMLELPYMILFLNRASGLEKIEKSLEVEKNCLFAYAGGFYKDIRNPNFALELFESLDLKFSFLLFTTYREEKFQRIIGRSFNIFKLMEEVDHQEIFNWLLTADFLVSIGNTVVMQIPAKIFEYISLGKPIIHFSKIPNDPAIKYLNLYPAVLIIKEFEANNEDQVKLVKGFIDDYKGITISTDEIRECFVEFSEAVVTKKFLSILENK